MRAFSAPIPDLKKPQKIRLDQLLVDRGLAESRAKAQALILAGQVSVMGTPVIKMGKTVPDDAAVAIERGPRFVSRGGEKLDGALDDFKIDVAGLVCVDVGASTGGFTDCLLQRGAAHVYAVDVGTGQIHSAMRNDPRVESWEETHILSVTRDRFLQTPRLATIDVSFISMTKILSHVRSLLDPGATVIAMVKPQFEVGAKFLKKGIVRDPAMQKQAVSDIIRSAQESGFAVLGETPSRLKGPKGNQEYFLHMKAI